MCASGLGVRVDDLLQGVGLFACHRYLTGHRLDITSASRGLNGAEGMVDPQ
ncbi:hypothetical protein [Streptomyces longispororuber]|uniref:hypothetical protein n=1 Tax=Streptomyces longispororuber TaxID=68230 RepID=UPI00210D5B0E|nr:hypothetical protein [Streptomyces longispororuber]MCQ4205762.1 hypothetical protein [Streptomyces longispororuber]